MWTAVVSVISWLGGSKALIQSGIDLWAKKMGVDLEKFKASTDSDKANSLAAIGYDGKRVDAHVQVIMQAMNHPIFWVAWGLFVLPVGLHHAAVFWVSTFPFWGWPVLEVPAMQAETAKQIVGTIFLAQAGTGITAAIVDAINKRRPK